MASQREILFGLLLFEFCLFSLTITTVSVQGVSSPMCDLSNIGAQYCPNSPSGTSSGTVGGTSSTGGADTVSPQTQQTQSCGIGGLIGGILGGVAGGIVSGGIAAVGGFVGGAALGCYVSATFFPQQGASAYNSVVANVPILGSFVQLIVVALTYASPLISFLSDSTNFELALFSNNAFVPLAAFLFPIQIITLSWLFFTIADYVRGLGATG